MWWLSNVYGKVIWTSRQFEVTHDFLNGEKVHKCTERGDSFGQGVYLKGHTLTHSEEKEHKCTECGNLFGPPNLCRKPCSQTKPQPSKCLI